MSHIFESNAQLHFGRDHLYFVFVSSMCSLNAKNVPVQKSSADKSSIEHSFLIGDCFQCLHCPTSGKSRRAQITMKSVQPSELMQL